VLLLVILPNDVLGLRHMVRLSLRECRLMTLQPTTTLNVGGVHVCRAVRDGGPGPLLSPGAGQMRQRCLVRPYRSVEGPTVAERRCVAGSTVAARRTEPPGVTRQSVAAGPRGAPSTRTP
jgi:hypothetical protein